MVAKLCQILKTAWYTRRSLGGNFSPSSAVLDPRVGHTMNHSPVAAIAVHLQLSLLQLFLTQTGPCRYIIKP